MKISVIIPVLNDLSRLKTTLSNISEFFGETKYEVIIIDGASVDGTVAYLKKLVYKNMLWISERDNGIYDAMNKGIKRCKSDWSIFMNAGDGFYNNLTFADLKNLLSDDVDALYGDCVIRYPDFYIKKNARALNSIWKGIPFSHQSLFVRTPVLKRFTFNTLYRIASDYDQLNRLRNNDLRFKRVHFPIAVVEMGGVSDKLLLSSSAEQFKISKRNNKLSLINYMYFLSLAIKILFVKFLRILIPKRLYYLGLKMIMRNRILKT